MRVPEGAVEIGNGLQDVDALRGLFQTVFGHTISDAHWRWKYHQGPKLANAHAILRCPESGQPLAHAGAQMVAGTQAGRPIRMAQVCDIMVHPSVRGDLGPTNVYRRVTTALLRRLVELGPTQWPLCCYGVPGHRPFALGERMGLYRRLYECVNCDSSWAEPRSAWAPVWRWRLREVSRFDDGRAQRAIEASARATQLPSAAISPSSRPTIDKTTAYLHWRYAEHPGRPYRLWLLSPPLGGPTGWLVTAAEPQPTLVDCGLDAVPGGAALGLSLLAGLTGQSSWLTWVPHEGAQCLPSAIVPIELSAATAFHRDWLPPQFQPGDTDVF